MNKFYFGILKREALVSGSETALNADQSTEYNNKYYFKWWEKDCYQAIAIDLWAMYEKIIDTWLVNENEIEDSEYENNALKLMEHKENCNNFIINHDYKKFLECYENYNKNLVYKFTWSVSKEEIGR